MSRVAHGAHPADRAQLQGIPITNCAFLGQEASRLRLTVTSFCLSTSSQKYPHSRDDRHRFSWSDISAI